MTTFASSDGIRLAYEELGDGEPLLFVQGLGYDRRGFGPRAAVAVDERGAHRSQQPFAHDDPSIARVSRFQATRAEQHDARDSAPATQSVLHRRLAEDEVGVTGIEVQHAARGHGWQSRPRLQPRHELADGPVELEPDVDFARL